MIFLAQAIKANGFVYTSGQIPLDPATRKFFFFERDKILERESKLFSSIIENLVEGDIKVQTKQVLTNLSAVLEAAGSSLEKVVKTTVFLKDMNNFVPMNEVYGTVSCCHLG